MSFHRINQVISGELPIFCALVYYQVYRIPLYVNIVLFDFGSLKI